MDREGPPLLALTRRLAETPPEFLAEPRIGKSGKVHVAAVVRDLLERLSARAEIAQLAPFEPEDQKERVRLSVTLLLCWLLCEEWFQGKKLGAPVLLAMLQKAPLEIEAKAGVPKLLADADRREELARVFLAHLALRPEGETKPQAQDRLTLLSTAERKKVLAAAAAAEERARKIREALAKKAAEESADKWTRE